MPTFDFFRFFPLPGAQNHVKTTVFEHRQDRRRGRRGARNTVKNDVFEPYTQNTPQITGCKCDRGSTQGRAKVGPRSGQGRAGPRSTQGRSAAGGVHAYNLRLPTEGLRHKHGRPGPAPGFKGLRLTAGRRPKKGRRKYVEPRSDRRPPASTRALGRRPDFFFFFFFFFFFVFFFFFFFCFFFFFFFFVVSRLVLSRGRFAVKVVVLEGPLDNYSLQELKAIFVHFRVFS